MRRTEEPHPCMSRYRHRTKTFFASRIFFASRGSETSPLQLQAEVREAKRRSLEGSEEEPLGDGTARGSQNLGGQPKTGANHWCDTFVLGQDRHPREMSPFILVNGKFWLK